MRRWKRRTNAAASSASPEARPASSASSDGRSIREMVLLEPASVAAGGVAAARLALRACRGALAAGEDGRPRETASGEGVRHAVAADLARRVLDERVERPAGDR